MPSTSLRTMILVAAIVAVATFGVTALLVNIFEHKQEARATFVLLAEVDETTTDPVPWGQTFPYQFDTYKRTVDVTHTRYGGSSAMPASKLDESPWLKRLYAGYAFSIDYRERRGHAYMLYDQEVTERVTKRQQSGACLHCHASIVPTYRRLGLEAAGQPADAAALGSSFNWPAVLRGFEAVSTRPYEEVRAEVIATPDGTPGPSEPLFPGGEPADEVEHQAHPVSCIDCHDPRTMSVRITRPGFLNGIRALAKGDAPVPHLPSIERWRRGARAEAYDPNTDASRQEMRSFVCGQCHVEYYCADKMTLTFPWGDGLQVEDAESYWQRTTFPDGSEFKDFVHAETGAPMFKAQHPEFEVWSQGIHARAGVSCADCHMAYEKQGATKVSSHWVRSPLLDLNNACQTCHNVPEEELQARVARIQDTTKGLLDRAAVALTDMLDAILEAQAAGASDEQLSKAYDLQTAAAWRLDYVSSENSMGFHAPQESARILAESIDLSRRAQALAVALRAPRAPAIAPPENAVLGVTPARSVGEQSD